MRVSILFLLIVAATLSWAQSDRGVITGLVADQTGAMVAGATIRAVNDSTKVEVSTTSTSSGSYTIPSVAPGTYTVIVESPGFKQLRRTNVVVAAGSTVAANAALEVGQVSESISVESSAVQLQTETSKTSTAVNSRQVDELPLVVGGAMRGAFDLALIAPQASKPQGAPGGEDKAFSIGGGQAASYGATLDGVSVLTGRFNSVEWANVNTPSVDALTEFAVETNGFKAEYGRGSGGMITFASKSGTNEFHGTAYEFLRNNVLDARRFFEAKRGTYKQNDFGFSAGGPVFIPKFYDGRNKTFVFGAMEWFRNRVGAASDFFSVPTPEMYQGDFSNWVFNGNERLTIYDPATTRTVSGGARVRDAFANNRIPAARISPFAAKYLDVVGNLAHPNTGAAPGTSAYVRNNYVNNSGTRLDPWTKWSIKADHNFNTSNRVSFLYNYGLHQIVPGPDGFPGLPGVLGNTRLGRQKSDVYRGTFTKVISPTLIFYGFGGVNFWKEANSATTLDGGWESKGVCLAGAWDCNRNLFSAQFSDYSRWVADAYDGSENFVFSYGNDLTWIKANHTFKFGYLWERVHYNGFGQQSIGGFAQGNRLSTSVPGVNNLLTGGGNGFASFLLGQAFSGGTENNRFVGQQFRSHAFYAQDDWKITPRLTMNIGVRYEFTLPPLEQKDRWSDFDPVKPNPRAGGIPGALKFAGTGEGREGTRTITPGWFGGIGPRLGLAYQMDDKTVIRAGGGINYGVVKAVTGSTHFEGAVLIFRPSSLDNGITPAFTLDGGLPGYTRPPVIDPSFSNGNNTAYWDNEAVKLPKNYQWSFSIQRELAQGTIFEATYNATMGSGLVAGLKRINQLPFSVLDTYGRTLLTSNVASQAAVAAGITRPYSSIDCDFSRTCAPVSVAQAIRPFPQYLDIQTAAGHGDKSGHSTYHAAVLKLERAYRNGLTLQGSYVFSKMLTDADSFDADNSALDHYNRGLEKSIGEYDVTHDFKANYVYELPFGKGKTWLTSGPASWLLGDWRISGTHFWASGFPLQLNNSVVFPIFNGRNSATAGSYDGWLTNLKNPDWKGKDRYFVPGASFGTQPTDRPGNLTRKNPKARAPWVQESNFSLSKSIPIREALRMDLRWEMFNAFNYARFNPGSQNIQDANFGLVNSTLNEPRRMQLGLKLYF
ncbi:MAG: TonB-dependent receptor [Bryobacterales bacterium]|nr:TonB-dependent receptor [Bryobacterales bacterium]